MTGIFYNTKFQTARIPAMNEYSVLSIDIDKQSALILGLYACAMDWTVA
jgi:hypothetical protein